MSLLLALAGAGGPTSYTLTCDAGAYSIAGGDAALQVTRNYTLLCDPGAYALAGGDATLQVTRNYALTCDPGVYVLTGNDATLTYSSGAVNYTLACDAGSYTISGSPATLTVTSSRSADQNSGGYYVSLPSGRRKSKREVYLERVRLGIIKEEIQAVAEKIVAKKVEKAPIVVDKFKILDHNRPDVADMVVTLMKELRVTVKSPDYTRSIQAALAVQRLKQAKMLKDAEDEDEEDALLLLM